MRMDIIPYCFILLIVLANLFAETKSEKQVDDLFDRYWEYRVKEYPEFATRTGVHKYDHKLMDLSLCAYHKRKVNAKKFLLEAKNLLSKSHENQDKENLQIFMFGLTYYIKNLNAQSYLYPVSIMRGVQDMFLVTINFMKLDTEKDYMKLLARFKKFPKQINQAIGLMKEGIRKNKTLHELSVRGIPEKLSQMQASPEQTKFYSKFQNMPENITEKSREKLRNQAKIIILKKILPAYQKLERFLRQEYLPATRKNISVSSLPGGVRYYKTRLETQTESDKSPEEIHQIGLNEVSRINGEVRKIISEVGSNLTEKDFALDLLNRNEFKFTSQEELLELYEDIAKRVKSKLPSHFLKIPKIEVEVKLQPNTSSSGAFAYYLRGTPDGKRPGTVYLDRSLKIHSKITAKAIALHEAYPGHHLQISYALEMENVPAFRRSPDVHFYTAFVEGWGLYSEVLGYELGIYNTPYERYGHLANEIFRASRLVVDTGIHYLGWTKETAVEFLKSNTVLTDEAINKEVDRYITIPGQACAYKMGELKLKALRKLAEAELGTKFDIRKFHDTILRSNGPMSFVEEQINKYIRISQNEK